MIKYFRLFLSYLFQFMPKLKAARPRLRLQIEQEYTNVMLQPIIGAVPTWLQGSLVRNCSVPVYEKEKGPTHLFDGIAMLHSFCFEQGSVRYSSRFLKSQAYANVLQSDTEFYQHQKDLEKAENIQDAAVNVFKYNDDYVALTESPLPVRFDLDSLETLGNFDFADDLPQKNIFESAHPHYCAEKAELYNFFLEYGPKTQYVLYKIVKNSSQRHVIARIPVKKPSYMHSFSVTERHLVLVEYPLVLNPLRMLTASIDSFATFIGLFKWLPQQGTRFLVVEKATGKLVAETRAPAFFSFHHANAYDDKDGIVVDLTAHNFARLGHVLPQSKGSAETMHGLQRFRINLGDQSVHHESVLEGTLDFPKVPDSLDGKRYRYLYMVRFDGNNSSLVKYDWEQRSERSFEAPNSSIIEPVFIKAPHALREDDGVLLTVVGNESSKQCFLLVLNAQDLSEMARLALPEMMPNSFHGQFF